MMIQESQWISAKIQKALRWHLYRSFWHVPRYGRYGRYGYAWSWRDASGGQRWGDADDGGDPALAFRSFTFFYMVLPLMASGIPLAGRPHRWSSNTGSSWSVPSSVEQSAGKVQKEHRCWGWTQRPARPGRMYHRPSYDPFIPFPFDKRSMALRILWGYYGPDIHRHHWFVSASTESISPGHRDHRGLDGNWGRIRGFFSCRNQYKPVTRQSGTEVVSLVSLGFFVVVLRMSLRAWNHVTWRMKSSDT